MNFFRSSTFLPRSVPNWFRNIFIESPRNVISEILLEVSMEILFIKLAESSSKWAIISLDIAMESTFMETKLAASKDVNIRDTSSTKSFELIFMTY